MLQNWCNFIHSVIYFPSKCNALTEFVINLILVSNVLASCSTRSWYKFVSKLSFNILESSWAYVPGTDLSKCTAWEESIREQIWWAVCTWFWNSATDIGVEEIWPNASFLTCRIRSMSSLTPVDVACTGLPHPDAGWEMDKHCAKHVH